MRKTKRKNLLMRPETPGFTLVELLLVVALLSIVSLSVYQCLSNGIRIWEFSRRFSVEEDIAIFFDKLERDLHNAVTFESIEFSGKEKSIQIPCRLRTRADKNHPLGPDNYIEQTGRVEYEFNKLKSKLYRRQANYSQALNKKFGEEHLLASGDINDVEFYYYYSEEGVESYKQLTGGSRGRPKGVKVEVEINETTGGKRKITRFINIPISQ